MINSSKDSDAIAAWRQVASMFGEQQGFNMEFEQRIKALENKIQQLG